MKSYIVLRGELFAPASDVPIDTPFGADTYSEEWCEGHATEAEAKAVINGAAHVYSPDFAVQNPAQRFGVDSRGEFVTPGTPRMAVQS